MEALWATILFSGFALEVIIRPKKIYTIPLQYFPENQSVTVVVGNFNHYFLLNFLHFTEFGINPIFC